MDSQQKSKGKIGKDLGYIIILLALFARPSLAARIVCCGDESGTFKSATLDGSSTCSTTFGNRFTEADPKYCPDIGTSTTTPITATHTTFTPNVGIPGSDQFQAGKAQAVTGTTLGEWIAAIYAFLSGIIAIIAAVMVMWGGFKWLTAAGNSGRISDAKDVIYSAIVAILLTLGAFILLRTINPDLVKIQDLSSLIKPVGRIEQPLGVSVMTSEGILLDPAKAAEKNTFNAMGCPTREEMANGFEVYLTGYYRPAWNQADGYSSFACNVGMQCRCDHDKRPNLACSAGSLSWPPCDLSKLREDAYCNVTASGDQPNYDRAPLSGIPFFPTAAASDCFGFQTEFQLKRDNPDDSLTAAFAPREWIIDDRGSDIRGRHIDLYMGEGAAGRARALAITGKAIMRIAISCNESTKQCDPVEWDLLRHPWPGFP